MGNTDLDSKVDRGGSEERTQAYTVASMVPYGSSRAPVSDQSYSTRVAGGERRSDNEGIQMKANRYKLGIYLLANYPSKERFLQAVRICQDLGVDFLEIGFAFSDPIADGDILEAASQEILKRYTLADFIESFKEARAIFGKRIYIMTYTNIVYSQGVTAFIKRVGHISGLILADLPLRETPLFEKELKGSRVNLIRFLTPESREHDVALALKGARDFIYFVSKRGTTGGSFELDAQTREKIARVRGKGLDVYVGFGIREKKDLDLACAAADGAIIGTKAVSELEQGIDRFRGFLKSLI